MERFGGMNILYYHQYFKFPYQAGGTRSFEIASELISRGHNVTMVCSYDKAFSTLKETANGRYEGAVNGLKIIAFDIPYDNKMGLFKRAVAFAKFALRSASLVFTEKYDLLFATSTPISTAFPGILAKIFRPSKKFVFEIRDPWPDVPIAMGVKNPLFILPMKILELGAYNLADGLVGLSSGMVDIMKKRTRNKAKPIILAPNMSNIGQFVPTSDRAKNLDGLDDSLFTGIFAGAHGKVNNLGFLLDVAASLKKKGRTDIAILLIGDGREKPELERRAKAENLDNVKFYPPMPKTRIAEITAKCDVGLMVNSDIPLFHYGNSPNKYFEFLAAGLPMLTNMKGFVENGVKDNKCGLFSEPHDADAFADNFAFLADNPETCKEMGINARKLAETEYSRDIITKRVSALIEQVNPAKPC